MAEQIWNNPTTPTTLSANITSTSATSCTVNSATNYPTTGNFRIQIDSELMEVTAVSGTTFTIVRGTENTIAATHSSGATVNIVLTQAAILGLRSDLDQVGTYASLPTSGMNQGDRYQATDCPMHAIYNGAAWQWFHGDWQIVPPATLSWTARTAQAAAPFSSSGGMRVCLPTTSATANQTGQDGISYNTTTGPPVSVTAFIKWGATSSANYQCSAGIYVYGTGGPVVLLVVEPQTTYSEIGIEKQSPLGTETTDYFRVSAAAINPNAGAWFKIRDDGTNLTYSMSPDGFNWIQLLQDSRTNYVVAPAGFGWCVVGDGSSYPSAFSLISFAQGT